MIYLEVFSKRLYDLRKSKGLNQKELGEILGLTNKAISTMESGTRGTSVDKLVEIAQYFGVSTDYLVGLTDDPRPRKRREG